MLLSTIALALPMFNFFDQNFGHLSLPRKNTIFRLLSPASLSFVDCNNLYPALAYSYLYWLWLWLWGPSFYYPPPTIYCAANLEMKGKRIGFDSRRLYKTNSGLSFTSEIEMSRRRKGKGRRQRQLTHTDPTNWDPNPLLTEGSS